MVAFQGPAASVGAIHDTLSQVVSPGRSRLASPGPNWATTPIWPADFTALSASLPIVVVFSPYTFWESLMQDKSGNEGLGVRKSPKKGPARATAPEKDRRLFDSDDPPPKPTATPEAIVPHDPGPKPDHLSSANQREETEPQQPSIQHIARHRCEETAHLWRHKVGLIGPAGPLQGDKIIHLGL